MALLSSGRSSMLPINPNKSQPQSTVKKEIEGWEKNVQKDLNKMEAYDPGLPNIFKVPSILRDLEKTDPYTPCLVSIGPCCRYKHEEIEKHKKHLLQLVLNRESKSLGDLNEGDMIVNLIDDAKLCFDKPMLEGLNNIRLLEILLLDACFILELLHNYSNGWERCGYNNPLYVLYRRGFLPFIRRDLLMLENQLPFSVLFKIYKVFWDSMVLEQTVVNLVLTFFKTVIPGISGNISVIDNPLHLLNIVHLSLEPTTAKQGSQTYTLRSRDQEEGKTLSVHSVTRLRGTGIKFEKKDSPKFTEIEFKKGKLLIPPLLIHGSTRSTFLNLMAFEQCYPDCGRHITSYISFMDGLIDSSKDVEHLVVKGIISHHLGSDEDVATLINNLRKEMVFDTNKNYMSDISKQLNEHYEQKWRTWTTTLKREYLKDPWKIISLVVAALLILFTSAQAAYSMGNPLTLPQVQGSAPRRSPGCPVVRSEPETIT